MSRQWIWEPPAELVEKTNVYKFMQRLGIRSRRRFIRFSQEHLETFWDEMVKQVGIEWFQPYDTVLDTTDGVEWARWFVNGRLNVAWNCLDRHAQGPDADKAACLWEGEDQTCRTITFAELSSEVNRLANALRQLRLEKGDRVALCMPMVPEVIVILYACLKAGLIAVPIFSGFGPRAVATRLEDCGARMLFTADYLPRRGKMIPLKEKADQARARG